MQPLMGKVHENSTKKSASAAARHHKMHNIQKPNKKQSLLLSISRSYLSISSSAMLGMKVKKEDSETFKLFLSFS